MTLDMTNNRVPYGLLDDDEWAALLAHEKAGGEFKCYCEGVWSKCEPSWSTEGIYRTVPLPAQRSEQSSLKTQDVIAWDRLPAWVEWVARDADFYVHGHSLGPYIKNQDKIWLSHGRRSPNLHNFPGIVQIGTCDWKDSKQRRPK
jgi:hypothetical protein